MFFKMIKTSVNIIMTNVIEILRRIIMHLHKNYNRQVSEGPTKQHSSEIVQCAVVCLINEVTNIVIIWWLSLTHWLEFAIMKGALLLIVGFLLYCEGSVVTTNDVLNQRPIIGVLSQEQSFYLHTKFPEENYTSYIAASYVKSVEAAGARVVPILIGKQRSYYEELMEKINGVLLPGGATYFNQSNGYADAGQMIYEIAQKLNDAGNYFPIFGTCLGFELLIILASGRGEKENRIRCYSYENVPLQFEQLYRGSKMFRSAPEMVIDILKNLNVTANAHQFCIVDENLKSHNLTHDWRVTSHSYDEHGVEFIASIEHTIYPFYGVQFHPEKIAFEWKLSKNYPHSWEALVANRYFMDFFVKECRKNFNSFSNASEENGYLIYNYAPQFTGVLGSAYHQCYFFEPRGNITSYH